MIQLRPTAQDQESHTFLSLVARNLKALLREPTQVASICPSLRELNERIAGGKEIREARVVAEIGPGNGETTRALLKRMRPDAKLLAIEMAPEFIESLNALDDARLIVRQGNALFLQDFLQREHLTSVDVVVSGVPFSALSADAAADLMDAVYQSLRPGGTFIAYQFRSDVVRLAEPILGAPEVERVWKNVPPLRIFRWIKPDVITRHG